MTVPSIFSPHRTYAWQWHMADPANGYSGVVTDEFGRVIAERLTEEEARIIAAAPSALIALEKIDRGAMSGEEAANIARAALGAQQ